MWEGGQRRLKLSDGLFFFWGGGGGGGERGRTDGKDRRNCMHIHV